MPAPIALFAFNRPDHLQRTIAALASNELANESALTVFCDGPRNPAEKEKTDTVQRIAHDAQGFASVRVLVAERNKGLAPSLIAGITAMLEEDERIIVLEDDLSTSPYFLRFMNDGLEMYASNTKVASLHGFFSRILLKMPQRRFLCGEQAVGGGLLGKEHGSFLTVIPLPC